jgi:hypothetical protein
VPGFCYISEQERIYPFVFVNDAVLTAHFGDVVEFAEGPPDDGNWAAVEPVAVDDAKPAKPAKEVK